MDGGRGYLPGMRTSAPRLLALLLLAGSSGCGIQAIPRAGNQVEAAWGEVQNQYQRRADLIPNLVATVKGYAAHERETLDAVTRARASATQVTLTTDDTDPASVAKFEAAQGELTRALGKLLMVSERYPELKADQGFRDLQAQLEGTENRISIARRRYVEAVQVYNNLLTVPPTSFTNSLIYHRKPRPQFEATTAQPEVPPEVKF